MSNKHSDAILYNFHTYFPAIAKEVIASSHLGKHSILLTLVNGKQLEYNDLNGTIRAVREYNGSPGDWKRMFAATLRRYMDERGYTQDFLAERVGLSVGSISHYVREHSIPSAYDAVRIAKALGCPVTELICFDK